MSFLTEIRPTSLPLLSTTGRCLIPCEVVSRLTSSSEASFPIVMTFFDITCSMGVSSEMSLVMILMASRSVKIPMHFWLLSVMTIEPTFFSRSVLTASLAVMLDFAVTTSSIIMCFTVSTFVWPLFSLGFLTIKVNCLGIHKNAVRETFRVNKGKRVSDQVFADSIWWFEVQCGQKDSRQW